MDYITQVLIDVFTSLLVVAYLTCGYYLLKKNKSKQPTLIAIWALFMASSTVLMIQTCTKTAFYVNQSASSEIITSISFLLFSTGNWIFSFKYFTSSITVKAILERRQKPFGQKKKVLWVVIALIFVSFIVMNILYFTKNVDAVGDNVFVIMNSINLSVNIVCSIMVTYSVITISQITGKLPHHLKDDTNMISLHLILFNLSSALELALVIIGWDHGISLKLGLYMTYASVGFLEQLLIAAVIVKFSNP